jgi:hypothetical protein
VDRGEGGCQVHPRSFIVIPTIRIIRTIRIFRTVRSNRMDRIIRMIRIDPVDSDASFSLSI